MIMNHVKRVTILERAEEMMGLTIALDPECCGVPPLKLVLTLMCDGPECGIFKTSTAFRSVDGFIGSYHDAITAGWKDTNRDGARVMLCPMCSGKRGT